MNRMCARRRGVLSVEMALVTPVLVLLMFGTVEFGLLFRSMLQSQNVARDAARAAAIGETPAAIMERVSSTAAGLRSDQLTISLEYRTKSGGTWSSWCALQDGGTYNTAPSGAQVRSLVTYHHQLVTPGFACWLADAPTSGTKTLSSQVVMHRE